MDQLAQQGKALPEHVHREIEAYLKCGRLEHGLLRVRCDKCYFERLVAFSCKKRGFCPSCGARRMAETAALLADEVFPDVPLRQWVISFPFPLRYLFAGHPQSMAKVPGKAELEELVQLISQRVGRCLERHGLLEQDTESAWLDLEPAEHTDAMPQLLGSSISYRIAVGPQQGRKAFMIRTIRPLERPDPGLERVAKANGFSLHAGDSYEGNQKDKREARAAIRSAGTSPALRWPSRVYRSVPPARWFTP